MNERLKEVRKALNLSQEEFGKKLGVSRGVIVNMELSRAEIKPLFIEHLCSVFNVNKEWLLNGIEEMFQQNEITIVSQLTNEYHLDELDQRIIESYLQLEESQRKVIKDYVKSIFMDQLKSETANEIDMEVESYRHELEQEKNTKTSSVLQQSGENVG